MRVHDLIVANDLLPDSIRQITHEANQFRSDIHFQFSQPVMLLDAKSLLGMLMVPIRAGAAVTIRTKGSDEKEAIDRMCELLQNASAAPGSGGVA